MQKNTALLALVSAGLLACTGDVPTAPASNVSLLPDPAVSFAAKQPGSTVHQQVTGHADVEFRFPTTTTVVDQYSFSAIRHQDGRFTGQFEFRAKYMGLRVRAHGEVRCFRIDGNKARLAGVITKTTFEESPPPGLSGLPVGEVLTWSVTDNRSNNDTASPLLGDPPQPTQDPFRFCERGLPYPETLIRRGSIQIHQ